MSTAAHSAKSDKVNKAALGTSQQRDAKMLRLIEMQRDAEGKWRVQKSNGALDSTADPGKPSALNEDPFSALMDQGQVIEPPFDILTLAMLPEQSSELNQCIEAMEFNIETTGHRFVSRLKLEQKQATPQEEREGEPIKTPAAPKPTSDGIQTPTPKLPGTMKPLIGNEDTQKPDPATQELLDKERIEKTKLVNFFEYCTDESFKAFRRKLRRDLETTGNAYFEVLRNTDGEITGFYHIPSYQMRLARLEDDSVLVTRKVLALQEDGSVQIKNVKEYKRFRRFVQTRAVNLRRLTVVEGSKLRWFKQFGDPRNYNRETGEMEVEGKPVPTDKRANEMIHLRIYSARTPYGLPRYIGNLLSIFGDRAAEEINYITFRNNNIPSMAVLVSNGQLTDGTIKRIESFVDSQIQGSDNYSKFLIVEAEPIEEEGEDGGQVKIQIEPLVTNQHSDALFQEYSKNNQDKIRRAYRLPPIFVGRSDDYSRATAEASRKLADEQIFGPERDEFDSMVNRWLFPEMGILYHKYKSNTPNTTDNAQIVRILAGAEKTGGMTPRIARSMLEEVLGTDLPDFPKQFPADIPFSLTMAEAVKNQADPTEPGQQVTALKMIDQLTSGGEDSDDNEDDFPVKKVLKQLTALQVGFDMLWQDRVKKSSAE